MGDVYKEILSSLSRLQIKIGLKEILAHFAHNFLGETKQVGRNYPPEAPC